MSIRAFDFFFHPFSEPSAIPIQVCSIAMNIALKVFSGGAYLLISGMVHAIERRRTLRSRTQPLQQQNLFINQISNRIQRAALSDVVPNSPSTALTEVSQKKNLLSTNPILQPSPKNFIGCSALKQKQQEHLHKLQALAQKEEWNHLQSHTTHQDSGFDWWMFPVNRASASYGDVYRIGLQDIENIKQNIEFMVNYRSGVILVAKSWGWDLENHVVIKNQKQHWTGYSVRLGKMLQSLTLFRQKDLHQSLVHFIDQANIRSDLEGWIQQYLVPIPS